MTRLVCGVVAVAMIPFALTSYNGATLLGVAAITTFIALTFWAPNKENRS